MKKILIIQTASIGDVILITPMLEQLHVSWPDAALDVLIKQGNEHLFEAHPYINQLLIWNKKERKYRNLYDLLKIIQNRRYDFVINVQRFASSGALTVFSRAKKTIGFSKNPFSVFYGKRIKHVIGRNNSNHEIHRNLRLLEPLGIEGDAKVKLYPSPSDYAMVSQYKTHQYITVSPASLWFTKQLPVTKWIEFLRELDKELYVYLLGSKADLSICNEIIKESNRESILNLSGSLSLLESAALMEHSLMNYVNDSAPMHLASSVNAPVTAVFCSTVPEFGFGPLSDRSIIIQSEKKLECKPCGLHGKKSCPEEHFDCAMTIRAKQLIDSLAE